MKGGDINLDLLGIAIVPLFVHFVVLIWYMGNGVFIFFNCSGDECSAVSSMRREGHAAVPSWI